MPVKQATSDMQTDPRYLARIAIYYGFNQNDLLTDYSLNMSTGGVFIESSQILPEDTELTVKFKLPDYDNIIVAKVRVAWTNDPDSMKKTSLPSGMGLQFLDLSIENMHAIRTYLDKGRFEPTW